MRAWLPARSHFGLKLGLALARLQRDQVAILAFAGDMKQFDEASEPPPFALAGDHRRPALVVIFRIDVAAAVPRIERIGAHSDSERPEWMRDEHEGRAETVVDPAPRLAFLDEA